MLNDKEFGEIQYETMWQKKDSYVLYGKEFEIIFLFKEMKTRYQLVYKNKHI